MPITLRRAKDRGHFDHGWLDTWHTFSFAGYQDPAQMGFRALRVINEDSVKPGKGFGTHGHRDMEILTYVLEGTLEHQDSMGNRGTIRAGEVQAITAGTGITHSEANPSPTEGVHFLQLWVLPNQDGLTPAYQQRSFPAGSRDGKLELIASSKAGEAALTVNQDVRLWAGKLEQGQRATVSLAKGRHAWVHVARGSLKVQGNALSGGDGAAISGEFEVVLEGVDRGEALVFDLA